VHQAVLNICKKLLANPNFYRTQRNATHSKSNSKLTSTCHPLNTHLMLLCTSACRSSHRLKNKWFETTGSPDLMQLSASNCPEHIQKIIRKPEFLQECQTLKPKKQTDFHLSPLGCSLPSTCWSAGVSESCISGRQLQVMSTNVHMAGVTQPFLFALSFWTIIGTRPALHRPIHVQH